MKKERIQTAQYMQFKNLRGFVNLCLFSNTCLLLQMQAFRLSYDRLAEKAESDLLTYDNFPEFYKEKVFVCALLTATKSKAYKFLALIKDDYKPAYMMCNCGMFDSIGPRFVVGNVYPNAEKLTYYITHLYEYRNYGKNR